MDLAIHILTACCLVGAGVALVFLYKLVYQLEIIIERMNRRIDAMKDYEESMTELVKRLEATQPRPIRFELNRDALKKAIEDHFTKLSVVEPPLDFPNEEK